MLPQCYIEVAMIKQNWKRATFFFFKTDVAKVLGIHPKSLTRYCKKNSIKLENLNLAELLEFIENYRRNEKKE